MKVKLICSVDMNQLNFDSANSLAMKSRHLYTNTDLDTADSEPCG